MVNYHRDVLNIEKHIYFSQCKLQTMLYAPQNRWKMLRIEFGWKGCECILNTTMENRIWKFWSKVWNLISFDWRDLEHGVTTTLHITCRMPHATHTDIHKAHNSHSISETRIDCLSPQKSRTFMYYSERSWFILCGLL